MTRRNFFRTLLAGGMTTVVAGMRVARRRRASDDRWRRFVWEEGDVRIVKGTSKR